jgi:hypothetical protein
MARLAVTRPLRNMRGPRRGTHERTRPTTTVLSHLYAVERELGHGGTARVYLAVDLKHDRRVP